MTSKYDYTNNLNQFRTYSYHFILTMSNTSTALRSLVGGDSKNALSIVEGARLGQRVMSEKLGNEEVYLLLDTRKYSQFSIKDLKTEYVYGTGDRTNPSTMVGTMSMQIEDSTGLGFFNMLMDIMRNKLRTERSSAFMLLTTLFVGHAYDGSTQIVDVSSQPLMMLLLDFTLSSAGSTVNLELIAQDGGAVMHKNT